MAHWKKSEAGYMIISNPANRKQYFCEKFHNREEMAELEAKYGWLNAQFEYKIGCFQNNAEIVESMVNYEPIVADDFFVEPAEWSPSRHLDVSWANLTEGAFQEKWEWAHKQDHLLTYEEALDRNLRTYYGFTSGTNQKGRERVNELHLRGCYSDEEKAQWYFGVQRYHILVWDTEAKEYYPYGFVEGEPELFEIEG